MNNPVDLLRGAINDAAPNFAKVTPDHLDLPTPCDGWDLRTLLNHANSRLDLSARAARNEPIDDFAQVEIDHIGDNASPLDQLVAFLGRQPSATAPASTDRAVAV